MTDIVPNKTVNGFSIPTLGLGTRLIGGSNVPDTSKDKEWIEGIRCALDMGYTHIDTAEMYGGGHTEELIGTAIRGYDRGSLFLTSKVYFTNLRYDDVLQACENSLKRLGVDYLDLYLIHAPSEDDVSLKETMRAFDRLVDEGMIKHIGVSNFNIQQIEEAQKYSNNKIVNNQIEYSLITRNQGRYAGGIQNMEKEIIPYCQEHGIIITAERPLERGQLVKEGYSLLDELVKKYNKTHAQIAMNWILSKDNIITIPKSSNPQRLKENLGSIGRTMEKEDYKRLDNEAFISYEDNSVLGKK